MKYSLWLVGLGGVSGTLCRFFMSSLLNRLSFAYGTLFVNLLGSFLLGLLMGWGASKGWILFLGVGFLGAFTTFSTFNWDALQLIHQQEWGRLVAYLLCSVGGGLALIYIGYLTGIWMSPRR